MARRNGNVGGNTGAPLFVTANGATIFDASAPTSDGVWNQYSTDIFTATQNRYTFRLSTVTPDSQDRTT